MFTHLAAICRKTWPRLAAHACALVILLLVALVPQARAQQLADFRVIVHPQAAPRAVTRAFAADAFLKKVTRWPSGETIHPVDLKPDARARRRFSDVVLKRSVGAVRSYWQQRIFSGRDVPPPELDSDDAVVSFVLRNPGAIGYVSGAAKLAGAREIAVEP